MHHTFNCIRVLLEAASDFHLDGTTTGDELRVEHDVSGNTESVVKVSFDLIEDILGCASEHDGASLGALALSHEGEVVVSDLLDLEETALGTDIAVLELLGSVGDGGAGDTGDTVVVSLTDSADHSAVSVLEQEVLSGIADSLLGDDNVGLHSEDVFAHLADFLLFHHEGLLEVVFLGELHVGHRFSLLVLEGAIEENNSGVLDDTSHAGVGHVLVEHDTGENLALLKETTWNLLDFGVSLDVDLDEFAILAVDGLDGLDGEVNDEVAPLGGELGADA